MRVPGTLICAACLSLLAAMAGSVLAEPEPEPMARPTRPKVFSSPEELRRYLDLVRDYYSLNGKARYGKRTFPSQQKHSYENPLNFVRMLLAFGRQKQQEIMERHEQEDKSLRNKWLMLQPHDHLARYYDMME